MTNSSQHLLEAFLGAQSVARRLHVFRSTALGVLVRTSYSCGRDEANAILWASTHEQYLWGQYFDWHFNQRYRDPGVSLTGDPFLCALLERAVALPLEALPSLDLEAAVRAATVDFRVKRFWQYLHGDALLGFPAKLHHGRFLTTFREDAEKSPVRLLSP